MITIDPYLLLLLVACVFALVFGGLGYLRREGLSEQFVIEVAILTAILVGGSWLIGTPLNPFLFLFLLYVVTLRSRLIVDLANVLARRENYGLAFRLYNLGLAWWPDAASRLIVLTNKGVAQLHSGQVEQAIATLESVLAMEKRPRLGTKYEAGCRYNLAYAYELNGQDAKAVTQYNETIDLLPGSEYAQAAEAALKRRKKKHSGS
ncbi:MAG: tetratricopeptide repeat protein [Anaerolineae bacterium]|jgi:tetratricopeptide (TPR) repeat protein